MEFITPEEARARVDAGRSLDAVSLHAADLAGGDLPVVAVVALEGDRLGLGRDDATWRRMFSGGLKWSYRLIALITSYFTVFLV